LRTYPFLIAQDTLSRLGGRNVRFGKRFHRSPTRSFPIRVERGARNGILRAEE
jgi:hypothetical protein